MQSSVVTGVKSSALFYLLGIATAIVVHLIFGWEHRSLVPKSAMIGVAVTLVALPWALLNISNLLCPIKRFRNAGELMVHVVFLLAILILTQV